MREDTALLGLNADYRKKLKGDLESLKELQQQARETAAAMREVTPMGFTEATGMGATGEMMASVKESQAAGLQQLMDARDKDIQLAGAALKSDQAKLNNDLNRINETGAKDAEAAAKKAAAAQMRSWEDEFARERSLRVMSLGEEEQFWMDRLRAASAYAENYRAVMTKIWGYGAAAQVQLQAEMKRSHELQVGMMDDLARNRKKDEDEQLAGMERLVRPRAWTTPMTSATKKIVGFDMSKESAPFGGLTLSWIGETNPLPPETSMLWLMELIAKKAALFSWVSNELVADGMSFEEAVFGSFSKALAWGLDLAFLTGSGAGQPLGIINANNPALVTIAPETGQSGNHTIVYANLAKMYAQIHSLCRDNSVWIASNTAVPQLLKLTYPGSIGIPVMPQGPDGKFTMLTRPVLFTDKLPALGSQGDIVLCDLSQYAIGLRKDMSLDRSMHVGFLTDQIGYRAIMRVDGQSRWNKPVTPLNGTASLSWCVALQAR